MSPALFSLCLFVSSFAVLADEVAVGTLRFTLPAGYQHKLGQGIDTAVGSFRQEGSSSEIRYDIGPGAVENRASSLAQKSNSRIVQDRVIQTGLGKGRFVAVKTHEGSKFAAVFEAAPGVILYAIGLSEKQIADFISISESLRVIAKP